MEGEDARVKFQQDLVDFKADCLSKGWDEDEVDERVAEAFENFPWYKYAREDEGKNSWVWRVWNIFLFCLILYLGCGAYLAQNKRLRKNIQDKLFDLQLTYQQMRLARFSVFSLTKYVRMERITAESCVLSNPFFREDKKDCVFCSNASAVAVTQGSGDDLDWNQITKIPNVPLYSDVQIRYQHIQQMFAEGGTEIDNSVCSIFFSEMYTKMSDFFELSEEDVMERNISIGWKNCDGYGTRFYRKFFTRPMFVPVSAEIHLEKYFFLLQPSSNYIFAPSVGEKEGQSYIYQAQGEAVFSFFVPVSCHNDCMEEPVKVHLKDGEVVHFPNNGWRFYVDTLGDQLSIIYLSSYDF